MKKYEPVKKYALIYTYNFDSNSTIILCETFDKACNILKHAAEQEFSIEKEATYDVSLEHDTDWSYAKITQYMVDHENICEYRVTGELYEYI